MPSDSPTPRRRPRKITDDHVIELLREHVLMPDVPEPVARAVLTILIRRGLFAKDKRGIQLADHPDVLRDYPEDAGTALRRHLIEFVDHHKELALFTSIIVGTRHSGTGATGGPYWGGTASPARNTNDSDAARAKRLEWNRDQVIRDFGRGLSRQAAQLIDHVISRLGAVPGRQAGDAPGRGQPPPDVGAHAIPAHAAASVFLLKESSPVGDAAKVPPVAVLAPTSPPPANQAADELVPVTGWNSIFEVLGRDRPTRSAITWIKRVNEDLKGPIRWQGHKPIAGRAALLSWRATLQAFAEERELAEQSRTATRRTIAESKGKSEGQDSLRLGQGERSR